MSKQSLFIAAIALAFAGCAQANTLTVTNTSDGPAPGPDGSLRRAINDAGSGDTINFSLPANSSVTLTNGQLLIEKSLTISGPGANLLSVRRGTATGTSQFRIFRIEGNFDVTLSGLTIANGNSDLPGGGVYADARVTLTNCTISGNTAGANNGGFSGGGIFNRFTLTLTNSTISGNTSGGDGGGISNFQSSTVTIINSTISGNTAYGAGGIYNQSGILGGVTITNSTISGNTATGGLGGGIRNVSGTLTTRNTIIAGNTALNGGPDMEGALISQGYNIIGNTNITTITGTTTGNQLNVIPRLGPLQDNGGPTFTHALLSGSTAIEGGDSGGSNTDQRGFARPVDDPSFGNVSGGDGSDIGAYEVQADLLPGCSNIDRVVNNNNDSGAGSLRAVIANVCAGSTITFAPNVRGAINLTSGELLINKGLTISGPGANLLNVQRSASAGTPNFRIFYIARGIATISGLTIANGNTNAGGAGNGGGIFNGGMLTLTNAVISGNTASTSSGGGILNSSGTLTIINSTISGNSAAGGFGGGIWNYSGILTITNSTISGNSASNFGFGVGGGIINDGGGTLTITSSTISGNTAEIRGGGVRNTSGSTVRARNTIIARNTAPTGPDVDGALTSENFNLIGDKSGAAITPLQFSDQIGIAGSPTDPLLGPLQNNGGPTATHALLAGSSAINKGHSAGSSTDQRGFTRPIGIANASGGDGGDIGAFEFGGAAASLQILSITRSGNGPVVLEVAGFPYGVHRIQASVDLSLGSFIDIATVTADAAGRFQYQDPVAGLTNFYRVAFP